MINSLLSTEDPAVMAYGRLDVYWPDGPVESYQLNKPSVAIGRSTGNDIVLDTNAVSRYHVTVVQKDSQVYIEDLDSANGTYLDSTRMKPHEPLLLRGGEEIQIGDLRIIYQPEHPEPTDPTTKPILVPEEVTRRIEIVQSTYRVEIDDGELTVTPGAHVQTMLSIQNTGQEVDRYYVEVDGVPKEWVRLDRGEIELDPGIGTQVILSFKPLRRTDSTPGDYPVTVRVRAKSVPTQGAEAPLMLHVRSFSGFGIALGTPNVTPDTSFEVHLHNQGNAPLT